LGTNGYRKKLYECVVKDPSHNRDISHCQMATTVEAVVGAAYLEAGIGAAETVIESLELLSK